MTEHLGQIDRVCVTKLRDHSCLRQSVNDMYIEPRGYKLVRKKLPRISVLFPFLSAEVNNFDECMERVRAFK